MFHKKLGVRKFPFGVVTLSIVILAFFLGISSFVVADEQDWDKKEFESYLKSAEKGDSHHQYLVGEMMLIGKGTRKDRVEALKWLLKSAENCNRDAMVTLGSEYLMADEKTFNCKEGEKWLRKSAEYGHVLGQYHLGRIYYLGSGVKVDYVEAQKWFLKSAEQKYTPSHYVLGIMYSKGLGVEKNLLQAYVYFALAKLGDREVVEKSSIAQEKVAKFLSPVQIKEAMKLITDWKKRYDWQK